MTTNEAIKAVEKSGTRISKEKLLEAIRKSNAKDFACGTDGDHALCLVRLPK
jgi:transcriptional regulator of NAD metabolism